MASSSKTTVRYWFNQQPQARYISFNCYRHALEYVANVTKLEDPDWRAEIVPYAV